MSLRVSCVINRIEQCFLFVCDGTFLVKLTVKTGVSSRKIIHVAKGLFELCFVDFSESAKFVFGET